MKLGRNELGSEGAAVLADALTKNTTLTVLTLGGNEIGDYRFAQTSGVISILITGSEGAASLAEGLKRNVGLKMLRMVGNSIGDEGANSMAVMLRENR